MKKVKQKIKLYVSPDEHKTIKQFFDNIQLVKEELKPLAVEKFEDMLMFIASFYDFHVDETEKYSYNFKTHEILIKKKGSK